MRIGELARACDCPAETIRYYEKIELLPRAARRANGYRSYDDTQRKYLQFILRGKALGFNQQEVRRLIDLAQRQQATCAEVHNLLQEHIDDVRKRVRELQGMERALVKLKKQCQNGTLHDCPVIDELMF